MTTDRTTARVRALLKADKPWAAFWVAMRPRPLEWLAIFGGAVLIFVWKITTHG